ncbi:hypothetical protein [Sporomusa acidovorans]|uniref:Uncharacterized protein n=1 Tax=Sporomusa acidovorans (strain ATCC 49682 / DSM 3132 / Mol) TaxID=1123286 RepID=A0ABZ3J839_SPOA4|nr:hypothetical protein [Sporomusa acidovorans]OZC24122.1 hypothetical protein SPACI_02230 [Sporomusa acidovorans DSM 3132]SDF71803.1 hypothetical protein SAMN04488499_107113 [Sporomusa acidovorans]
MDNSISAEKKLGLTELMEDRSKSENKSPVRTLLECNAIVLAMFSLLLLNYL